MRPSVKYWGREINIRPACIIYTISSSVKPMNNFSRKRRRAPLTRHSKHSDTLSGIWTFSRIYASNINPNIIPFDTYAWIPSFCTTQPIMQMKTRPIFWSYFAMQRRSTICAMYQKESKAMVLSCGTHYISIGFMQYRMTKIRRRKQQGKICFLPYSISRTLIRPNFLT